MFTVLHGVISVRNVGASSGGSRPPWTPMLHRSPPAVHTSFLRSFPALSAEFVYPSVSDGCVRLWLNLLMFAHKLCVEYEDNGRRFPCSLKWLDSFSMRNFTNATVFDATLPVGDGLMEIGTQVPKEELRTALEDWFHRKNYLPKDTRLLLTEICI